MAQANIATPAEIPDIQPSEDAPETPPEKEVTEWRDAKGRLWHKDRDGNNRRKGKGNVLSDLDVSTPDEFIAMMDAIPQEAWPHHSIFIWRCDPIFDNTNGGREPKYIALQTQRVTEDSLKLAYGSGTYKLVLKDRSTLLAVGYITIDDMDHPPHMPPGDWLINPRNQKWLPWKPVIEKWWAQYLKSTTAQPNGNGTGDASTGELTKLISTLVHQQTNRPPESSENKELTGTLVKWALEQTKEQRKEDSPSKFTEMVTAFKSLVPPPPPPVPHDDSMTKFLLDRLGKLEESNTALMSRLIDVVQKQNAPPPPPPSAIDQVKQVTDIIAAVSGIAQPSEPKPMLQSVLENGIPRVVDAAERFFTARALAGPRPMVTRPAAAPAPVSVPAATNPAPVSPVTQTADNVSANQPTEAEPQMDMMQRTILTNIAKRASSALDLGMTGDQFGDQMLRLVGEVQFDAVVGNIPKDQMIPLLQSVPEAWAMLQPFDLQLPQFIEHFYEFALSDPGDEEDEPEPLVPAAAPAAPADFRSKNSRSKKTSKKKGATAK